MIDDLGVVNLAARTSLGGLKTAGFSGVEKYVFGWHFSGSPFAAMIDTASEKP
jgi:hypothetical protein